MSVGFAFIYGVHDLLRAAHKPFGTTLKREREKEKAFFGENHFCIHGLPFYRIKTDLHIRDPVLVFMYRQISLGH